jgi:uncharacterized membrane protein YgdD (TMEM256/DUF423 family)
MTAPPPADLPAARAALVAGALLAGLAVALGAFGAHGLDGRVTTDRLATFETGVRYHMYHALGLLAVGLLLRQRGGRVLRAAAWSFAAGVLIFSGSLYVLVLTDTPILGAVTPFGGVAFIAGWALLAWGVWRGPSTNDDRQQGAPAGDR